MSLLEYILTSNVVFAILFAAYMLFLRKETFFLANRAWLLGSAALAVVLPLLPRPSVLQDLPSLTLPTVDLAESAAPMAVGYHWSELVFLVYAIGVAIGLGRLIVEFVRAWQASKGAAGDEGFSFLWRVVVPEELEASDREALLLHEQTHVRHGHSYDVLFFRTVQAFNWFVPIWSLALRELKLVHEHTADAEARVHHADYETLLLAHAFGVPRNVLTNSFRSSDLKTRITMMLKRPSTNSARIKYLSAIPLVVLAIAIGAPMRSATPFQAPQTDVVSKAEVMPEFPGGMDGLIKYLGEEVKYPNSSAGGNEVPAGTVHVQFIVSATGAVEKVTVKKGSSMELDMEAIRVVRAMPKWTPGKNEGKPVAVQMVLPIRFEPS